PKTDPRSLRLYVDGVELPIFVAGEDDGRFDANDSVEFYGLGLDTPSTDTRVYWLITGTQPGLRIDKAPFAKGYPSGESFAYTVERRDRAIYFSALKNGDEENFFGAVVSGNELEQRVTLNNLAASARENAVIQVSLQGVTTLWHQVIVSLNGSSIGRLVFNGQARAQEKIEVPQGLLLEGENVFTLQSINGPSDISLVDLIRITYQHTHRAENDALSFIAKSGQTTTINGFSTKEVRVFDVTDERRVQELAVTIEEAKDGYAATVTASVASLGAPGTSERKLLALTDERALQASSVKANSPSHLLDANNSADFIIISEAGLIDSLRPLTDLRSKQGLVSSVVDIEDVYDEFSFGSKSPQSVRDFISYAAKSWKVRPRFVLFGGDASYDARNYLGFGNNDLVPTKLIDTAYMETASDDWLADFNNDGIADLNVGRLPVRTAEEASTVVNKLIAYDKSASSNEVALVADSNDGFDFEKAATSLRALLPPDLRVSEIFRSRTDDATARTELLEAINRGQKIVNYTGHGSVNVWRGSLLTASDGRLLTNGEHLSLFVTMTCLNGYYQDAMNDSLGESLLKAEKGGAVAVWASSAMCLPEEQAIMNRELYRLLFSGSNRGSTLAELMREAKRAISDANIRRSWILLGDPTMRLK
ncbi:MAG TPA: C25 family cysteine peptidase, partial [Blastocatellia bacterium]|nr:C25 family cysteine peptidase [Blastocatellia bacterium]